MSRKPRTPTFSWNALNRGNLTASNGNASSSPYKQGIDALHKELRGLRADEPTLNGLELRSVQALISYVAYSHSISEDCVLSLLNGYFETDSVEKIYQADFDSAVTFLVDLNPRVVMN